MDDTVRRLARHLHPADREKRTVGTVKTGDLVVIPEDGYLYELGALALRLTGVSAMADAGWVRLAGHEISWNGERLGRRAVVAKVPAVRRLR